MYANYNAMQNNNSTSACAAEAAAFACALTVWGFAVLAMPFFVISVLLLAVVGIIRVSPFTA